MTKNVSPRGFRGITANVGLKPFDDDFMTIVSAVPARSTAIFTRSRFAGPSVMLSRASALARRSRGIVVLSGNANVATGRAGAEHATEVRTRVARLARIRPHELMIGSTGAIGRPYPMDVVRRGLDAVPWPLAKADFEAAAAAMMTGDTHAKSVHLRCGNARLVGIAKGGGVAEHDRATLLAFFFSDADLPLEGMDDIFQRVMARTFHGSSIETDTATSDTAALFTNGLAGPVKWADFEPALDDAALCLAHQIASENEPSEERLVPDLPTAETALAIEDASMS
jgi:glutamate N-acetyltransferase/amino-acid N-acetyltransferase